MARMTEDDWKVLAGGGAVSLFNFTPPGPVADGFIFGIEPIDFIMGPWGSGKTTAAVIKCAGVTMQFPPCTDGIIRARGCVIRDNFRTLYRTTLDSWFEFFPKDFPGSTFEGGQDRPFKHTVRFRTPKGQKIEMMVDGYGIGDHAIENLLKGYQPSWAWINEADLVGRKVPSWLYGRLGRYPKRSLLADPDAKLPRTVFGDLNPPPITHWIVEDFVEKARPGYRLRRQPSGLSEAAENKFGHPRERYEAMAATMAEDEVRRFVHGEFGLMGDGALVYDSFRHQEHVAKAPLKPVDVPLALAFDAGGSPAMVVMQLTPKGQLRVLSELCADPGTGPGRFAEMAVDLLLSLYPGLPIMGAWGDPAGFYGADRVAGELSWMEMVGKAIGTPIMPAPSQDPGIRQESVAWFLRKPGQRDETFFVIDPGCKVLLGGFMGGFTIALNPHDTAQKVRFTKNKYSHPHEALQYGALGLRGREGVIGAAARAGRPGNVVQLGPRRPAPAPGGFSVWDV